MKRWLNKFIVALATVFTLGTFIPSNDYVKSDQSNSKSESESPETHDDRSASIKEDYHHQAMFPEEEIDDSDWISERFTTSITEQAYDQTMKKFGSTIRERIEQEYIEVILPEIENVIGLISQEMDPARLVYLKVTEEPAAGLSERIFHLYDERTGKDLARFHVRRDHPPKQGYWFNFHYHLSDDNFEQHHELGSIYWDKHTPPHWMHTS